MTKILVVLLLAVCVFGQNPQTAVFPGASPMSPTVVTDSDLPVVNQSAQTKLNGGINASQTSGIVLVDGSRFKAPIIITIGTEKIFCTTLTTNTLSGCTRGYNVGNGATLAATHADQADVYAYIEPKHFNQAYKEIQSLETHAELIDRKDQNGGYVGRDSSGNASVPGSMTAAGFSMLYSGVGQYVEMKQGTAPPDPAANSFQLRAPSSIPAAYFWAVPSADAVGLLKSNGSGQLAVAPIALTELPAAAKIRICEVHLWGTGTSGVLQDTDDEVESCKNKYGANWTITAVDCYANAGTPTIMPTNVGVSGHNVLSGNLSCGAGTWAAGSLTGTGADLVVPANGTLNLNIVAAGGTATNIRIVVTGTI